MMLIQALTVVVVFLLEFLKTQCVAGEMRR
jgi:hypothetical protein